jgi:hypothetical protein
MTEAEWAECHEPQMMLDWLKSRGKLSDRKARLFGVACCRRIWQYLKDTRSRRLVEIAESFADGAANLKRLRAAFDSAAKALEAIHWKDGDAVDQSAAEAVLGLRYELQMAQVWQGIAEASGEARAVEAWERIYQTPGRDSRTQEAEHEEECEAGAQAEREVQVTLLRDMIGNPFRPPPSIDPAWLAWNHGTVPRLAEAAYEERDLPSGHLDPARLAVLADALEDAGCGDASLLGHLRDESPHIRGCWALDLILSKELQQGREREITSQAEVPNVAGDPGVTPEA